MRLAGPEVVEGVANLVAKSLVVADLGGEMPCYRLLGTTRAYALDKLLDSGEFEQVKRRRATYATRARPPAEPAPSAAAKRLAACGRRFDYLSARAVPARAALETGNGAEHPTKWWQTPSVVGAP